MQIICWIMGIKLLKHLEIVNLHLSIKKKSDDAAYDYMSKGVNNFIQKIESMAEKIKFVRGCF